MPSPIIRIATRKSPLALWQANAIREQLLRHWPDLEIEFLPMATSGDRFLKDKLLKIGGKGLFVKELEEALMDKRADLAVHSMKDVPVAFPEGLSLAAICPRHNPFDALVSPLYENIHGLPYGAIVGTSSLRRQSQLLALRPDLNIQGLRGNIHTRLEKLDQGGYHAIVLASAGLERMTLQSRIQQQFSPEEMLPACGQGALGIECRTDDAFMQKLLQPLNDTLTASCVHAERRVNSLLGGNCHTPLAVYCRPLEDATFTLSAKIASANGQQIIQNQQHGELHQLMDLAERSVQTLLVDGAKALLDAVDG